mmetsp:Transcript_133028/g.331983  ORF Transcript_133028/g.331983 Transcript_133028/m.331983 type:complete len:219 (-) Transcript_133028:831-1487(-)
MHISAPARGSACLEAARARLRARFSTRWPQAGAAELALYRSTTEQYAGHADVDASGARSPLEEARQRLRARYLAKWPAGEDCTSPRLAGALKDNSMVTSMVATENLQAAHQRLHARYAARWPAGASRAEVSAPPLGNKENGTDSQHAKESTQLTRITTWANSLHVPIVIASAPTGHIKHVNIAWERMCGYTSKEVVGQTADILAGEGTDERAANPILN